LRNGIARFRAADLVTWIDIVSAIWSNPDVREGFSLESAQYGAKEDELDR
jgi:hypothetical protein